MTVLLMVSGVSACSGGDEPVAEREAMFTSVDGVALGATVYTPAKAAQTPPGLILVHRYAGDRTAWEGFARAARQQGVQCIAVDLRGHGASRMRDGQSIHYAALSNSAIRDSLHDIDAAKRHLLESGAHPDNLAIMGEGLGANLALHYALQSPDIQAVVMISPGLEHKGVRTEQEIKRLVDCPALLITGEGDAYAAMSTAALKAAAPVFAELRTWPGAAHGADLFASRPEAVRHVLQWLHGILSKE